MIRQKGTVTVREENVAVEGFAFEGVENQHAAAIEAMEWAIKRLQQAIEEERNA